MFNKTRKRIVLTVVLSLLALMTVTLTTIYLFNRVSLNARNAEMLRTYAERFMIGQVPRAEQGSKPDGKHDEPPVHDRSDPAFRLSTFYAVAFGPDGEVLAVENGNDGMQSEESLVRTASEIVSSGKTSGKTGNMAFLKEERSAYTLVAMIDETMDARNQQMLFYEMLVIGGASLAVLTVLAVFLARRIVRPLEENDEKQKRFVSDAGHELKTPIAVISANSELLKQQIGQSEWLDKIDYENGRMSDLVRQLLTLSKVSGSGEITETLDFSKLVQGEVLPFESLAFEMGRLIEASIEPALFVKGDPNRLRRLISVLLDNALSHGTGETVRISLHREHHTAVLATENEAKAWSEEQAAHLFDRFYRADEARGEGEGHYGLGLSIAQAIVEAHGGRIRAAYKDGRAVFSVLLPTAKK